LPRSVGEYKNLIVTIGVGRFGPYIKYDSKFTSLKKTDDPLTITLDRAIELIEAKLESDEKRIIKTFPKEKDIVVMKDRWGKPCIKFKTKYLKIPKGIVPEEISIEKCKEIIDSEIKPTIKRKVKSKK